MGKPYASELEQLASTYSAAMSIDVEQLSSAIIDAGNLPLILVGSGGSLTAAHFVASLHQKFAQACASVMTPLELIESGLVTRDVVVWCLSAGGSNPDIKEVFRIVALREPQHLLAVCAQTHSPLSRLAKQYQYTTCFDFDLPTQRDGFLATNSLLAFFILFARAYQIAFRTGESLPKNLLDILHPFKSLAHLGAELENDCLALWKRSSLIVLYGISVKSTAVDLESKFTEAALGSISLSDYRNFAHGRHHWLAKREDDTAVLAITTDGEEDLADKTLEHLPSSIPTTRIHCSGNNIIAAIKALVGGFYVVSFAGKARCIDPGRPGVPQFGRELYNLRVGDMQVIKSSRKVDLLTVAITRKTRTSAKVLQARGEFEFWINAYRKFTQELQNAQFSAVVFDYDGTLCAPCDRFGALRNNISKNILRLLKSGISIGVATGRGKSVKESLRSSIPKKYWQQVLVGYYNGADCGFLSDDHHPDGSEDPCSELEPLAKALQQNLHLSQLANVTVRRAQITIEPAVSATATHIWHLIYGMIHSLNIDSVKVVRSSHSIDVLASSVSKLSLVDKVQTRFLSLLDTTKSEVLCIGDKGFWPGNDFELLSKAFSLSVDEVSSDPLSCWNLSPAGYRGVQATLAYLSYMKVTSDKFSLTLENENH